MKKISKTKRKMCFDRVRRKSYLSNDQFKRKNTTIRHRKMNKSNCFVNSLFYNHIRDAKAISIRRSRFVNETLRARYSTRTHDERIDKCRKEQIRNFLRVNFHHRFHNYCLRLRLKFHPDKTFETSNSFIKSYLLSYHDRELKTLRIKNIQKSHDLLKSKQMNKSDEERARFFYDQQNMKINQFII
jgi:hypothetical protein